MAGTCSGRGRDRRQSQHGEVEIAVIEDGKSELTAKATLERLRTERTVEIRIFVSYFLGKTRRMLIRRTDDMRGDRAFIFLTPSWQIDLGV